MRTLAGDRRGARRRRTDRRVVLRPDQRDGALLLLVQHAPLPGRQHAGRGAGTGTVIRADTLRRYATDAGFARSRRSTWSTHSSCSTGSPNRSRAGRDHASRSRDAAISSSKMTCKLPLHRRGPVLEHLAGLGEIGRLQIGEVGREPRLAITAHGERVGERRGSASRSIPVHGKSRLPVFGKPPIGSNSPPRMGTVTHLSIANTEVTKRVHE